MLELKGRFREIIPDALRDPSVWPTVNVLALTVKDQELYSRRRKAVMMYMGGEQLSAIQQGTDLPPSETVRLAKRCLSRDESGLIWGFRALLPYLRLRPHTRRTPVRPFPGGAGSAGALSLLFHEHPAVKERVEALALHKPIKDETTEPDIAVRRIFQQFITACQDEHIPEGAYPYTSRTLARRSITQYVHNLRLRETGQVARVELGESAARLLRSTGSGHHRFDAVVRPYQCCQLDGHRLDTDVTVLVPTPKGDLCPRLMKRPWLLLLIDVDSRAVLAWHLTSSLEYSAEDVLHCVQRAVVPWNRPPATLPGLEYAADWGMPGEIPELAWAVWDELMIDRAKSQLAGVVRDRLTRVIGGAVNVGPVASPERRAIVERFFKLFEEVFGHRLPSTTGSNPLDPRRRNPEKQALQVGVRFDDIEQVIALTMAWYNARPHEALYGASPLEYLTRKVVHQKELVRVIPESERDFLAFIGLTKAVKVCGDRRKGRRPYVNLWYVHYTNEVLARSYDLVGKKLNVTVNIEDLRVVKAFFESGAELGTLTAARPWNLQPHSLKVRQEIYRLIDDGALRVDTNTDPVTAYLRYLASQQGRRATSTYARVQRGTRSRKGRASSAMSESIAGEASAETAFPAVTTSARWEVDGDPLHGPTTDALSDSDAGTTSDQLDKSPLTLGPTAEPRVLSRRSRKDAISPRDAPTQAPAKTEPAPVRSPQGEPDGTSARPSNAAAPPAPDVEGEGARPSVRSPQIPSMPRRAIY